MEDASLELMLKSALPVDDVDQLLMGANDGIAVIWVDITDRPDLHYLGEQRQEAAGYAVCTWFYAHIEKQNMLIGLRIEMKQPMRNVMHIVLKVEHYLEQLSLVAKSGKLWIVPGPPPIHLKGAIVMDARTFIEKVVVQSGTGFMIELQPHLITELQDQLTRWKRARA